MPLQPKEYYEELHLRSLRNVQHYSTCKYYGMWQQVIMQLWKNDIWKVFEIGSGVGQFGQYCRDSGISYRGVDLSESAVKICEKKRLDVICGDATKVLTCLGYIDIVCLETLEHVEDDYSVLENINKGYSCYISLPIFMEESHVRSFPTLKSIRDRYKRHLDIKEHWKYDKRHLIEAVKI